MSSGKKPEPQTCNLHEHIYKKHIKYKISQLMHNYMHIALNKIGSLRRKTAIYEHFYQVFHTNFVDISKNNCFLYKF